MNTNSKNTTNSLNCFSIEIQNLHPTIGIYTDNIEDMKRRNAEHLPTDLQAQLDLKPTEQVGLSTICDDSCIPYQLDLEAYPSLAAWYYSHRAYRALSEHTTFQHLNFTQDWVYWVLEEKYDDAGNIYKKGNKALMGRFHKFSLQFRGYKTQGDDKLHINCYVVDEGTSYILLRNVQQLLMEHHINTQKIGKVLYNKQLKSYKALKSKESSRSEKIYPIANRYICKVCKINIDYPKVAQKMKETKQHIDRVMSSLLDTVTFKAMVPHSSKWNIANEAKQIVRQSTAYRFGNHRTSSDIQTGLKEYGPHQAPQAKHTHLFFIIPSQGLALYEKLKQHIHNESGYTKLESYSHLKTYHEEELDLNLNDDRNIPKQVEEHIAKIEKEPDTNYFAIYISPYNKYDPDKAKRSVYYHVKECLLKQHILSQVIDLEKGNSSSLNYWIPNIASAMVSKLGGIPWLLDKEEEEELVIGFGAKRCHDNDELYIGSAFCFNNNGCFQDFECWPKSEEWALLGQLKLAIERFKRQHKSIKRIIIHYYKEISKQDFDMIENMLDELNYNFPVVVVKINSSFCPNILAFNTQEDHQLLYNGSYIRLYHNDYLLYINTYKTKMQNPKKGPFPLKMSLQSNTVNYIHCPGVVEDIMQQLHDFTHLHWRSLAQPRIPVTIAYPKYLAHLSPHFRAQLTTTQSFDGLWFL